MEDHEKYTADKPVNKENEDRFQRYPFSKRIAETIINRSSSESIVFGLFGAWGEGKSSVINFIDEELAKSDQIIQIHLNPWRYSDEDTMLFAFFKKIAEALGRELQTKGEKAAGFVKKYGSSGSLLGFDFSGIGQSMDQVDLELLKNRVEEFLQESSSKLVVFIDDIDRLDKQEIYSLFRLIKLTADFSNTTYLLSFDETMVSAALGERFGAGDTKSGASFLEKIIQVPLNIPKAQPEALKKFCFNFVDHAFLANNLDLPKSEVQRFVLQFTTNILPRLNTPRLAVRYGNTISFSIPLLNGEVNIIDLLLIEAVKIFYPAHYEIIKHNAHFFIGSYKEFISHGRDQGKIDQLNKHLDELSKDLPSQQKNQIRDLLVNLFPALNTVFGNFWQNEGEENDWYKDKKIGSARYFDRYFSYAVIEGDISDVEFNDFMEGVAQRTDDGNLELVTKMLEDGEAGNLITKLRVHEGDIEWKKVEKLAKTISNISGALPNSGGMLGYGFETTFGQAAIFIYQLLKHHKDQDIFTLAKQLVTYPKDYAFAYNVNNWLRTGDQPEDKLFTEEQYDELAALLYKRAVADADDDSIFVKFPNHINYLASAWYKHDNAGFESYAKAYMDKDKANVLSLLKAFVPVGRSNVREGEYKVDITERQYRYITSLFDKDDLMRRIVENFPLEEINKEKAFMIDFGLKEFTELNMVRQFNRWFADDAAKEAVRSNEGEQQH